MAKGDHDKDRGRRGGWSWWEMVLEIEEAMETTLIKMCFFLKMIGGTLRSINMIDFRTRRP